ncbi:MAG: dihydrolipoyl dehydrogenase [Bacteriovoracaceae bacterium]
MKKNLVKVFVIVLFLSLIVLANKYELQNYLTLDFLKENLDQFKNYYAQNQFQTIAIFMGIYILSTALSIPGATVLTLGSGALFGLTHGLIIVSFASTIGATFSFLAARFLLRDYVQKKFKSRLATINEGVQKEGAFYLFSLRLIPAFPFFLINLVMGLTPIKVITYFFVSQIGMLPGTFVYVNAGKQLGNIESLKGIFSIELILSFSLLGLFPIVAKKILGLFQAKQAYKGFKKPKKFDYNMIAIGGGAAGLVTSYISAAVKAKVALIEKHKMGGDCLNTGCVPSKALIRSSKVVHYQKRAKEFGIDEIKVSFNFKDVMNRIQNVIKKIEPHDSIERYTNLGVDCIQGEATILDPWTVEVNGKKLTTKNITIATGASPFVPPIKGIESIPYLTSENLWGLEELPQKFIVLGAGPIGLEIAQSFNRLGSDVTVVEMGPNIMGKEDSDVSEEIHNRLSEEGVKILTNHKAVEFHNENGNFTLSCENSEQTIKLPFDQVLVAVGRRANIKGFGLENLNVELRANGTIEANEFLQTNYPNIYVCGDVTGPFQLTHTAAHQAWYCAVNGLFGKFKKFKVDYSVIPWCTYTDPEVATVGLTENMAKEKEIPYEVTKYGIDDLDRAIADSEDHGFVKVLTEPGTDRIIGATVVGNHASDLILEFISAMKFKIGLNKILSTIHIYPTMGEANKYLAGVWKQKHAPKKLLEFVKRFHEWQRS